MHATLPLCENSNIVAVVLIVGSSVDLFVMLPLVVLHLRITGGGMSCTVYIVAMHQLMVRGGIFALSVYHEVVCIV